MENVRQTWFTSVDYTWNICSNTHKKEIVHLPVVTSTLFLVVSGGISPGPMGTETSFIFLPPQSPDTLPLHKGCSVQSHYSLFSCGGSFILLIRNGLEEEGGGRGKKYKLGGNSLKKSKRSAGKRESHSPSAPILTLPSSCWTWCPGHHCLVHALRAAPVSTIFASGPRVKARAQAEQEWVCWGVQV